MEKHLLQPLSLKSHVFVRVIPVKNVNLILSTDVYIFWCRQFIFN